MNSSLQKTHLTRFFIIKPRHPGRLKKQIWVKKKQWESWSHAAKRLLR